MAHPFRAKQLVLLAVLCVLATPGSVSAQLDGTTTIKDAKWFVQQNCDTTDVPALNPALLDAAVAACGPSKDLKSPGFCDECARALFSTGSVLEELAMRIIEKKKLKAISDIPYACRVALVEYVAEAGGVSQAHIDEVNNVCTSGITALSLAGRAPPSLLEFTETAVPNDCNGLDPKSAPVTKLDAVKNACGPTQDVTVAATCTQCVAAMDDAVMPLTTNLVAGGALTTGCRTALRAYAAARSGLDTPRLRELFACEL